MISRVVTPVLVIGFALFIVFVVNPFGGHFTFHPPPGWVATSKYSAVDPVAQARGVAITMRSITAQCRTSDASPLLDYVARDRSVTRIREKSTAQIDGVAVARAVYETDGGKVRKLQYMMPEAGLCAEVTFSAPAELFDQNLPIFEASARNTRGLSSRSPGVGFIFRSIRLLVPIVIGLPLLIALSVRLDRRTKQKGASEWRDIM